MYWLNYLHAVTFDMKRDKLVSAWWRNYTKHVNFLFKTQRIYCVYPCELRAWEKRKTLSSPSLKFMPSEHSASWPAFQVAARSFVPHLGGPSWPGTPSPQQSLNANNHTKWMLRLPINNLEGNIFSLHMLLMTSRGATRQYNSYCLRVGLAPLYPTKRVEVFAIELFGWSLVTGFSVNVPLDYFY